MSGFDRKRFVGGKIAANKDMQKSASENNKPLFDDNGRVNFLTIEDGRNVFRILPPHPDDKSGATYVPYRVSRIECECKVYKNGESTGETEVKQKNVFIATQHGGLKADPIETYIDFVKARAADEFTDRDERQKFLAPITGWRGRDGKWNWGIAPATSFVCYAIKDGKIGRLELREQWIKDMDRMAISEDADDVIDVDIFSDPDEGYPLIISKGIEKNKTVFTLEKEVPRRGESWDEFFNRNRVSDEQLEELLKLDPLSKTYGKEVYTRRDWDLALDGLKRVDAKYKFNIFKNSEFIEKLSEIEASVKDDLRDDDDIKRNFSEKGRGDKRVEDEETESISVSEMRVALKRAIKRVYDEQYVDQIPASDKDVKKWYQKLINGDELPIEEKTADDVEESSSSDEPEPPVSTRDRLNKLRNR